MISYGPSNTQLHSWTLLNLVCCITTAMLWEM